MDQKLKHAGQVYRCHGRKHGNSFYISASKEPSEHNQQWNWSLTSRTIRTIERANIMVDWPQWPRENLLKYILSPTLNGVPKLRLPWGRTTPAIRSFTGRSFLEQLGLSIKRHLPSKMSFHMSDRFNTGQDSYLMTMVQTILIILTISNSITIICPHSQCCISIPWNHLSQE